MATTPPLGPLDFLAGAPEPVAAGAQPAEDPLDQLPAAVVDQLMQLPGVDGVWIERDAAGRRQVVLHYTPQGSTAHLPRSVHGLTTRVVGGEPIRAGL
jgi:hypothetical protein